MLLFSVISRITNENTEYHLIIWVIAHILLHFMSSCHDEQMSRWAAQFHPATFSLLPSRIGREVEM